MADAERLEAKVIVRAGIVGNLVHPEWRDERKLAVPAKSGRIQEVEIPGRSVKSKRPLKTLA